MKGYSITANKKIELITKEAAITPEDYAKVRITKAGIDNLDINLFKETGNFPVIPSKQGVGVISEIADNNSKSLKKGDRVFINPYLPCSECLQCKTGNKHICGNMKIMGRNSDGFLLDFINVPVNNLIWLPDQIGDSDAIFADNIALAIEIITSLKIEKGDYVVIAGANVLGNILAQLTMYYHAVPILIDQNEKNIKAARSSGIYYTVSKNDDAHKIVNQITGGRLAKYIIYILGCGYDIQKAIDLCSEGGTLSLCKYSEDNNLKINLTDILKKHIRILCFNNGYNHLQTALNILATKSIVVSNLITDTVKFDRTPEIFQSYSESLEPNDLFKLIVDTLA